MFAPTRHRCTAVVAAVAILTLAACERAEPDVAHDLAQILARDTLIVGTRYNSTSYFLYRGQPMGYEYELLSQFADAHGVHLRLLIVNTFEQMRELLRTGEADVLAARLFPDGVLEGEVAFTEPLFETQRVLVQRIGEPDAAAQTDVQARAVQGDDWGWDVPETVSVRARPIRDRAELRGETVHVGQESGAHRQLVELSDSIDGAIDIIEVEADITTETLIRRVATGAIELTVSRENVAQLQQERFANIEVRPIVGPPVGLVWATRLGSTELLAALNDWIRDGRDDEPFASLYRKYYIDRGGYRERAESEYLTSETGRLSQWDDITYRHAVAIGWDWRLLASVMYQESLFDPRARSWAGAMGLLQLMPATAREVGVTNPYDPEDNVGGGARYFQWLERQWVNDIEDPDERLRFILASYNVGRGHVQDAQRLAEAHGDDPDSWDDVSHWLLQKSKREVFTHPVVRFGYARGIEPVTYVQKILYRYDHYQRFVTDTPTGALAAR
jgi:membrane-bound lytic murein transglycosylase F